MGIGIISDDPPNVEIPDINSADPDASLSDFDLKLLYYFPMAQTT
jgi:hypothetical protein